MSEPRRRRPAVAAVVILVVVSIALSLAWAGGQGAATVAGWPVPVLAAAAAFVVQWIAFVPAFALQTERFYDLVGSLTWLTMVTTALILAGPTPRGALLVALIAVWAVRLGVFLYRRVHADGGDGRFDEIKPNGPRFLVAWTLQGAWVSITGAAAVAAISSPESPWAITDVIGGALWVIGFGLEVVADMQKRMHRREAPGQFITTGLWSWSQHPNYFGEILLWVGVTVIAAGAFQGAQWVTLASPLFIALLLTRVSGIPLLRKRAEARWGDDPAWRAYVSRTSLLVPRPPRG